MQKYVKITLVNGGTYIQPISKLSAAIAGEMECLEVGEEATIKFELIEMTEEEFDNLPAFTGH